MIPVQAQIYNLMIWILWMSVVNILLPGKLKLVPTLILELALYIPYTVIAVVLLPYESIWRTIIGESVIFLIFFFLHRGKWYIKTIVILSVILASFISDMLIFYLLDAELAASLQANPYDYSVSLYASSFLVNAILLSIVALLGMSMKKQYDFERNTPQIALFTLFPVSQFFLLICIMKTGWLSENTLSFSEAILIFASVVLSNIGLLLLIGETVKNTAESERVRAKEEVLKLKKRQVASLAVDQKKIETLEQSISEQFGEIEHRILRKEVGGTLDFPNREAVAELFPESLPECENRLLADFLSQREEEIRDHGIHTDFTAVLPASCNISDIDYICAFGNLLDNAEEACEGLAAPQICLIADMEMPYVRIVVENTCREQSIPRERRVAELDRGLGSAILKKLAEKYDGEYRAARDGEVFRSFLLLKGTEPDDIDRHLR